MLRDTFQITTASPGQLVQFGEWLANRHSAIVDFTACRYTDEDCFVPIFQAIRRSSQLTLIVREGTRWVDKCRVLGLDKACEINVQRAVAG